MTRRGVVPILLLSTAAAALVAGLAVPAGAQQSGRAASPGAHWVTAWQGSPVPGVAIPGTPCPAADGLHAQTVRNVVFTSAGGDRVRVRLANTFGANPLQVGAASVAIAGDGAATRGAAHALRFGRRRSVLIAAGGEALSDPMRLHVPALRELDVSVYVPGSTGPATQHSDAQHDNYLASGNRVAARGASAFGTTISCSLLTAGVDVRPARRVVGTVVTLGDSITDGAFSTNNANHRYPDYLARRLQSLRGRTLAVSNAGISGNDLLTNRTDVPFGAVFGPSALARLPRDVLAQAGARDVILLEGINDIGAMSARAAQLIMADEQVIAQAHTAGLRLYGATLVPFGGSNAQYGGDYGTAAGERQRQALNRWIRHGGAFDGVFDFDRAIRDPQHPSRMLPRYDSGDHLHPGDAGYRRMAQAVRLRALLRGV